MYRLRIIILFDFMMFRIKGECANVCWFMVVKNLLESPFSFELFVLHLSFGMMAPILPGKHRMNLALPLILLLNTKYTKWLTEESWSVNKKKKYQEIGLKFYRKLWSKITFDNFVSDGTFGIWSLKAV